MKKILFVSHDASRTGAPIALLSIIRNLKAQNKHLLDILLIQGGDLENDFTQSANKLFILNKKKTAFLFEKLLKKIINSNNFSMFLKEISKHLLSIYKKLQYWGIFRKLKKQNYSLIYVNSIVSVEFASRLKEALSVPVLLHIHELEYSIDSFIGHEYFSSCVSFFDRFIAVNEMVKQNLVDNYKIDKSKIAVAYPFSCNILPPNKKKEDILNELKIRDDSFIIGASGNGFWIKGCDIFISLAYSFFKKYPKTNCVFIWLGKLSESDYRNIHYDLENTDLLEKVKFIGERPNPVDYYNIFDVFTLVSRVDSFPLVCLENAYLSKPLICFDKSGYMPTFLKGGAGFVVPYLDVKSMSEKIYLLYNDPDLRTKLGINIKNKYLNNHFIESSMSQISHCIDSLIKP
ncbi:MAG: glycosyltransferase family 4 protein [Bacteroidales bacterium]|jgi:glycosyltransferase involved in cell wall biosynthesis|nr:glycosyltransferase family 4 protein [Bacteroidales bacterium]